MMADTEALDTPPRAQNVDLRTLFRAVGRPPQPLPEATDWRRRIVWHGDGPTDVTGTDPLDVVGAADGVQRRWLVHQIDGRPITLEAVSAAVLGHGVAVAAEERLYFAASSLDADWCHALPEGVPVVELDAVSPQGVARQAARTIDRLRRRLEHDVIRRAAETGTVLVDGAIRELGAIDDIVGVVKGVTTQYLGDESELMSLPVGSRSSQFTILPDYAQQHRVHSVYVRLHAPRPLDPWHHGLVRLEVLDSDRLDPLAARCLAERQHASSGDARWPVHLRCVRHVEDVLRSRHPSLS